MHKEDRWPCFHCCTALVYTGLALAYCVLSQGCDNALQWPYMWLSLNVVKVAQDSTATRAMMEAKADEDLTHAQGIKCIAIERQ